MGTKAKVRFSEISEQQKNPEPQQLQSPGWSSRLFGAWRSKEENNNNNNSRGHTAAPAPAQVAKPGERHAAHRGGRTIKIAEEDNDELEKERLDTDAEDFIAKQRKKLDMERLMSMKRVESMLNRGM